eukprot:m.43001 g.43001  ORF g.43001 m.43001 type:complete len:78 (+) comp9939_c0_seq1:773-1006(+)
MFPTKCRPDGANRTCTPCSSVVLMAERRNPSKCRHLLSAKTQQALHLGRTGFIHVINYSTTKRQTQQQKCDSNNINN